MLSAILLLSLTKSHGTHLFTIPFLLYLGLSPFIFILFSLESRKPIFGSRKIRYGETPWGKRLLSVIRIRDGNVSISYRPKKPLRRRIALLWLIALLFASLIAFFGLFGRVCLTQEHHIISYNAVNQESPFPTPEDYSHLTLQTKYVTGYRSPSYWKYRLTIEMTDGRSFSLFRPQL